EDRVLEGQRHGVVEVLDRGDLFEDLLETRLFRDVLASSLAGGDGLLPGLVTDQPVEAVGLESQERRNLEGFFDLCERDATGVTSGAARGQDVRPSKSSLKVKWRRRPLQHPSGQGESI